MAAHNTNRLLKYVLLPVIILMVMSLALRACHSSRPRSTHALMDQTTVKNNASGDSAAESLDTLTAELSATKQQVAQITQDNETFRKQNELLQQKAQGQQNETTSFLSNEITQLKSQIESIKTTSPINNDSSLPQPITIVPDIAVPTKSNNPFSFINDNKNPTGSTISTTPQKPKAIPYYTIPPNATSVHDRLMVGLVGRIPIKGIVMDPYPFKLVFSDDTLAANGLRIPNLRQMIVSGYTEGDLNLVSVRGWVTSLTFVFNDGRISTTTSNDNNIGHFTKDNALGYLSDKFGNPFIRGHLITNAPAFLTGNVLLSAGAGAANAYAQMQTTNQTNIMGSTTSTVTGSPGKFVAGQSISEGANEAQQWWHDREENSFDAVYVAIVGEDGNPTEIAVNFSKEIKIDYDPNQRKIFYVHDENIGVNRHLD